MEVPLAMCDIVCKIDPHPALKTRRRVRQHVDETSVVTTDSGNGGLLTGNRTQEVVGSIPISSTKLKSFPDKEIGS